MAGSGWSKKIIISGIFGLGLKMQPIESSSYTSKRRTMVMTPLPHQQQQQPASRGTIFNGDDDEEDNSSSGGRPFCSNTSYQVSSLSDIYDVAISAGAFLPTTWNPFTRECMPLFGKAVFTASQRQELERQTVICKYMMASVPVPPQLLLPLPKSQFPGPLSQSSTAVSAPSVMDVRFSSGSDTEPWRCRRTDGKKWRCSRTVIPGQKYCERHAHKSRPRSRKPVEFQSQNTDASYNYSLQQNSLPINTTICQPLAHLPSMGSVASCDQTRGIEMFSSKGGSGTIPFSACDKQWQNQMHSSTSMDSSRHKLELNKEQCSSLGIQMWENQHCNSQLDPKIAFVPENLNANTMQTRHFIDAWSTAEKRGRLDKVSKKECMTSSMKLPVSSLTLSIPSGNEVDHEDHEHGNTNIGVMKGLERSTTSKEGIQGQWTNPVAWMGTTPGGPLGEALCLGVASSVKGASSLPSSYGYSNSTTTTTSSSCSRSSCDNGSQAHNFIG